MTGKALNGQPEHMRMMMNKEQPEALQLPTLPFAVFDEFGQPCEDRVRDHFAAAFEALRAQIGQGVPEIDYEAMIAAAYKRDRKWAQGTNGCVAFKCGAEWFRSQMLASAHPAPQQKPLTYGQRKELIKKVAESINSYSIVMTHWPLVIDAVEAAHNIGEKT